MKPRARDAKPKAVAKRVPARIEPRGWITPWGTAAVVLILLLALFLRASSLTKFDAQEDEQTLHAVVENIWHGDLSNNWIHASIPSTRFRIDCYNFSSYFYADAAFTGLARISKYTVLWDRIFSVLLGTGAVFLVYLLALRLCNRSVALVACALTAVMPVLVQDAHYGRPEAFVTCLTLAAYLASFRKPALASVCFGLLVACKISMIPLCAIPLLCLSSQSRLTVRTTWIATACTVLGCFLGMPDAFFHPHAFWNGVEFVRSQYSGSHPPYGLADGSVVVTLTLKYFWQTTGPLFCLIAIAGMVVMVWKRQYLKLALVAAPAIFYLTYFSLQKVFFERNVSHIAPLLAICFAAGAVYLSDLLPRRELRASLLAALVLLAGAPPLLTSGRLVFEAMPTPTEARARDYETALATRLGYPIGSHTHLLTNQMVKDLVQRAEGAPSGLLVRVLDYRDSFTQKNMLDLTARTGARQVGYFPSIFENFSVNTLITYHSPALRYVLVPPRPGASFTFASWDRVGEPIQPAGMDLGTWVENGYFPEAGVPPGTNRFFGSFTSAGDANQGTIRLGPFPISGAKRIGIPMVTGPSTAGLSLIVADHATGKPIAQMTPPPLADAWSVWQMDLSQLHLSQIDIVATDSSSQWGGWLALGFPVYLREH